MLVLQGIGLSAGFIPFYFSYKRTRQAAGYETRERIKATAAHYKSSWRQSVLPQNTEDEDYSRVRSLQHYRIRASPYRFLPGKPHRARLSIPLRKGNKILLRNGAGEGRQPTRCQIHRALARSGFSAELEYLSLFDEAREAVRSILDMPDRKLELFVSLHIQGKGRLSTAKRELFSELSNIELASLESAIFPILARRDSAKKQERKINAQLTENAIIMKRIPTSIKIGAIVRLTILLSFSDQNLLTMSATRVTRMNSVEGQNKIGGHRRGHESKLRRDGGPS